MTVEGAVNVEVFRSYIREILLPTLRPGEILVMDNFSAHKDRYTLDLFKDVGVTVRLLGLFAGSEPDRTDVGQGQGASAQV